jgi:hypothetical protein
MCRVRCLLSLASPNGGVNGVGGLVGLPRFHPFQALSKTPLLLSSLKFALSGSDVPSPVLKVREDLTAELFFIILGLNILNSKYIS